MSIKEDNILTKAINKKISRRSFIKWSSALGATASMSGLVLQAGAKMAVAAGGKAPATAKTVDGGLIVQWKPSCCLVCHGWCHIAAGVDASGHVRKIEGAGGQPKMYGNKDIGDGTGTDIACRPVGATLQGKSDDANHIPTPAGYLAYAPHNKGRICAKGNDGVEHLYDPDRIKYPLERLGARGEGKWRKVTWDYALGRIADKLRTMAVAGNQHRLAVWVGRNEHFSPSTFSKAYGTPNHVEHTALCELSRHAAGRSLWGHHWSSIDLQEHTGITVAGPGWAGDTELATLTLNRDEHDADCYIEWGGNPAEAKIPHTTCANHMADRRRSNLVGFPAGAPTRYGRILNIDVRQSNTGAYADENFQIVPGTDGALALGIFYGVLDGRPDQIRQDLDRGHNGMVGGKTDGEAGYDPENRRYYGIFAAEEDNGLASGSDQAAVPVGESLESYLFELGGRPANDSFYDHIGAGTQDWGTAVTGVKARVAAITGLPEADVQYLTDLLYNGNGIHKNVLIDGYRGPCKHTNGTYNYRAIRALQYIAPNASSATFYPAATAQTVARGGYNAPGGFMSDNNWDPYGNGGGAPAADGKDTAIPSVGGIWGYSFGKNLLLPADQGVGADDAAPSDIQRIDNWDYELGLARWRGSYKWVDQNFNCGIRHSIELNAFIVDEGVSDVDGPYKLGDPNFQIEALIWHKNSPTYSRPNQDAEIEMLTKDVPQGSQNYLLDFTVAIDIAMGDGTRFADIILPDVSYLERYSERSGEGQEYNWRPNLFYRVPVYEVEGPNLGLPPGEGVPRHLYESKQVSAIFYELARKIEPSGSGSATPGSPWEGSLYDTFTWSSLDTGSVAGNPAYVNDGEWARREMVRTACNGVGPNIADTETSKPAGAADGFDYMMSHAMVWGSNDDPAYWRGHFRGDKNESNGTDTYAPNNGFGMAQTTAGAWDVRENGGKFTVYNTVLATMPDIDDGVDTAATRNDGSGHFYGQPVYNPIFTQTSGGYPRHLTTYKLNVHTQSRTACLPRLNEIIGNSWAVLPADGSDGGGAFCWADNGLPAPPTRQIRNGEVVRIDSSAGFIECVAKVTEKAQSACVHISTSQGHQRGIGQIDTDNKYTNPHREAFGTYLVDGLVAREQDRIGGPVDNWSVFSVPPSAPGKGTHPNKIIEHHLKNRVDGDNYNTDPLGGSQGWFDTKVRVT